MHMKKVLPVALLCALALVLPCCRSGAAEEHHATRLGSPATRFAAPLATPEDLRTRFRSETLKPDVASILDQWGWKGAVGDLYRAALTNEITEVSIPIGARMPFMASREGGRPVCLRNVLWEGREPIGAYAFTFSSKGRRYRCVTPKPCSNFFLEDLGGPALALACDTPGEVLAGKPIKVGLTPRNIGDAAETQVAVTLPIPEGATCLSPTNAPVYSAGQLRWTLSELAPGATNQISAVFTLGQPGSLQFVAIARGDLGEAAQCACATRVSGIPAILLEVVDLEDPVEVGKEVTYEIRVTNQGSTAGTHLRIVCTLPGSQEFVSGTGITAVRAEGRTITMEPLPVLAPKAVASWQVRVKALAAGDVRFLTAVSSDQFPNPIHEDESTRQY